MRSEIRNIFCLIVLAIGLTAATPFVSARACGTYAQNLISGYVFGLHRQPMSDLNVELFNDFGTTIGRTRTNGAGYYSFSTRAEGRFVVRVYTYATDYEEQERSVEIQNVGIPTSSGGTRRGGFEQAEADFYLKLRRGVTPENVAIFFQQVPPEAKKLYDKAVSDLNDKRTTEAIAKLRSAIEIFPRYYDALERLGTEYISLARPETFKAAEILLAVAVDVNARGFKSWYGLAYSRYSLGKNADALSAVQKAIELNAFSPDAALLCGVLQRKAKNFTEAEKYLLKANELSKGTMPHVHWELANLYGNDMNRNADAAKELRLFLKAQPDSKDAEKIKKLIADFEAKAQTK